MGECRPDARPIELPAPGCQDESIWLAVQGFNGRDTMPQVLVQEKPIAPSAAAGGRETWPAVAVCGLLLLGVFVLFARTSHQGFSNVDDNLYIFNEPHVSAGLSWSGLAWAFTNGPLGELYPLTMLSHMLDCQLYGLKPAGHHVTNVLLHAAATVGLFLVLWRMTRQRAVPEVAQASGGRVALAGPSATTLWPSALVAAIFAFHPLHVEPVAWLSQRRDMLSGLFFVATLGAYDEYTRHGRSLSRYLLVAGLFALGLLSKPILVTMPALLLLLDYWPLGRCRSLPLSTAASDSRPPQSVGRLVGEKLPLVALALIAAALTMRTHGMRPDSLTFAERLANAIVSCVVYLGQLFVPMGLSIFNSHPEAGRPAWQIVASLALLLAITVAVAIGWRRYPYLLVGWLWYLGLLVPVLGLVFVGPQARADRYTYLSQIGLYIALIWGAVELSARWPARRWVLGIGSAAIVAAMLACSWRQVGFWQTNRLLWEHAVACDPTSATSHCLLGAVLEDEQHDEDGASAEYRRALDIVAGGRDIYNWPRGKAHYRLGNLAARHGNAAEAVDHYRQALESDSQYLPARLELATILARSGQLDDAIDQFRQAIALAPARHRRSCVTWERRCLPKGSLRKRWPPSPRALQLDPKLVLAHFNLGVLLANRGDIDEAIGHFRQAIKISPSELAFYDALAALLRRQGKNDEAAEVERRGTAAKGTLGQ